MKEEKKYMYEKMATLEKDLSSKEFSDRKYDDLEGQMNRLKMEIKDLEDLNYQKQSIINDYSRKITES